MMNGKNPTSTSGNDGTIVEWLMRFWSPGDFNSRWGAGSRALIRQVTCRIVQPSDVPGDAELSECWSAEEIDNAFVNIQAGLDVLEPGRLYRLELDVPADSMYRSSGPAGPDTGRSEIKDLPPWLNKHDIYDYQVRPARFWFEVEQVPDSDPPAMRISTMHDDEENTNKRPPPARHQLRPDATLGVNHVDVDWRPDWLRRGRRGSRVDIRPSGGYPIHGGKPTHVVLHAIGVPDDRPVSNIGAAINTFVDNADNGGIHYIVDVDGHVLKLCPETRGVAHSNESWWRDKSGLNRRSVGIEHAWSGKPDVHPKAQIRATVDLVRALKLKFGIDGRNIAGHGEVRCIGEDEADVSTAVQTEPSKRTPEQRQRVKELEDGRREKLKKSNEKAKSKNQTDKIKTDEEIEKSVQSYLESKDLGFPYDKSWGLALHPNSRLASCPGPYFDWAYLAARGIVPEPSQDPLPDTAYAGLFGIAENLVLRDGDHDHGPSGPIWGGEESPWAGHTGTPVRELHDDLRSIGYTIPVGPWNADGHEYTALLKNTVKAFKARYMQDVNSRSRHYGHVDMKTAEMIKRVVAAYAKGPV